MITALQAALMMLDRDALKAVLKAPTPHRVEGRGRKARRVFTIESTGVPLPDARLALPGGQGARLQGGLPPRVRDNSKMFNTHGCVFGAIPPLWSEHGPTKGFWVDEESRSKRVA